MSVRKQRQEHKSESEPETDAERWSGGKEEKPLERQQEVGAGDTKTEGQGGVHPSESGEKAKRKK